MVDQLVIADPSIARQIRQIADQEHRTVEQVLGSLLARYQPPAPIVGDALDSDALARRVYLNAYTRAREYWHSVGDTDRASLTDMRLDEVFWWFDSDGIPRLKEDKGQVTVVPGSLHAAAEIFRETTFESGQTDISVRAREIMENEYAEYLLSRRGLADTDADST